MFLLISVVKVIHNAILINPYLILLFLLFSYFDWKIVQKQQQQQQQQHTSIAIPKTLY